MTNTVRSVSDVAASVANRTNGHTDPRIPRCTSGYAFDRRNLPASGRACLWRTEAGSRACELGLA